VCVWVIAICNGYDLEFICSMHMEESQLVLVHITEPFNGSLLEATVAAYKAVQIGYGSHRINADTVCNLDGSNTLIPEKPTLSHPENTLLPAIIMSDGKTPSNTQTGLFSVLESILQNGDAMGRCHAAEDVNWYLKSGKSILDASRKLMGNWDSTNARLNDTLKAEEELRDKFKQCHDLVPNGETKQAFDKQNKKANAAAVRLIEAHAIHDNLHQHKDLLSVHGNRIYMDLNAFRVAKLSAYQRGDQAGPDIVDVAKGALQTLRMLEPALERFKDPDSTWLSSMHELNMMMKEPTSSSSSSSALVLVCPRPRLPSSSSALVLVWLVLVWLVLFILSERLIGRPRPGRSLMEGYTERTGPGRYGT
jgi:hypothetical protein